MENCIFCKIVRGEIPSRKIYEDEKVLAFLDISPQSLGHTLVIPKKHFADIYEIDNEELCNLISSVKSISEHVKTVLKSDGIKIVQNNGVSAGQTVFHIHFHIIPVYDRIEEEIKSEDLEKVEKDLKMY